jgi:hypothetical protein
MRIWQHPFTIEQEAGMNEVIADYRLGIQNGFMEIFEEIDGEVNPLTPN